MKKKILYDKILIGSGIIFILEAIHLKFLGKKVLILEKKEDLGGAWKPLNLFGISNLENAIHYFLPNDEAISFIKNCLKLEVVKKKKKIIFFKNSFFLSKINYDNIFSKFLTELEKKKNFFLILRKYLFYKRQSLYLKKGSADLYKKIKELSLKFNLKILYNNEISAIKLDYNKNILIVKSNNVNFLTKKIGITHATDIFNCKGIFEDLNIKKKKLLRPSVHFYIDDNFNSEFEECIFNESNIIKYIHNITNYSQGNILKSKKIFVIGLRSNVKKSEKLYQKIFEIMKNKKIVGPEAKIKKTFWQNIYLPSMNDNDLKKIKIKYFNYIDCYKSADFTASLSYNLKKWKHTLLNAKL